MNPWAVFFDPRAGLTSVDHTRRGVRAPSRKLFLRFLGDSHFSRAYVFDDNSAGPILVNIVAIKAHGALDIKFVFNQLTVFEPELDRTFGIADCRRFAVSRPET